MALIILFELAIVMFLSMFSEPVVQIFGKPIIDPGLEGNARDRTARIIMLYHSLAVPFLAATSYFVLSKYPVREALEIQAKWAITSGALVTGFFGMLFGYGANIFFDGWVAHGLFIFGLSIAFYGGVLLTIGIWPTKRFATLKDQQELMWKGINLESLNMALTIVAILISGVIGAWAGANFGRGFNAVLAEDIVGNENHNLGYSYNEMVVSHLHIMIALLCGAVLLLTMKYSRLHGRLARLNHFLYIPGIVIISLGAWLVITPWDGAHKVINIGAGFLLTVGVITAIWGILQIHTRILGENYKQASPKDKIIATFKDPVELALYWQLIWVNVTSTFPGVYVAINLEKFRSPEYQDLERTFNTGHWHVLATICAIMILMLTIKWFDVKGWIYQFTGWTALIGSTIGFGFATLYMVGRKPGEEGFLTVLMIDVGTMFMFMSVGVFGIYYLVKKFTSNEFDS